MTQEETILDFDESEHWSDLCLDSIKYKSKTLDQWAEELTLPDVDVQNLDQVELVNQKAMKLTEVISKHLSLTKSSFYLAKASYNNKMHLEKCNIIDKISDSGTAKRSPSQDSLERMAMDKCLKEWRVMIKSEILYEFWQTHSYKINQIHSRLTSLNIIKNIESKQMVI